ncbi:MAG: Transcriptional regulator, LysR family, partial [uncultured Solirubrobacteraceae bacterium]
GRRDPPPAVVRRGRRGAQLHARCGAPAPRPAGALRADPPARAADGCSAARAHDAEGGSDPGGRGAAGACAMLLDGVEAAVQQVQDTAAGRTGRLRVGLAATASLDLTPL